MAIAIEEAQSRLELLRRKALKLEIEILALRHELEGQPSDNKTMEVYEQVVALWLAADKMIQNMTVIDTSEVD